MTIYGADKRPSQWNAQKWNNKKKGEVSHRATCSLWAIEERGYIAINSYGDIMKTRKASQGQRKTKSDRKTSDILLILNNYQYTSDSEDRFLDRQSNLIPLDLQTKA